MGEPGSRKPHILLIEDNPGDVELFRLALEHAGLDCDLTILDDGGRALAFIRQGPEADHAPLDLAVIDLNLPKNDGLEILEAMRVNVRFATLPIAVLSSSTLARERAKLEALHIKHHVTKPSDLEAFLQIGTLIKQVLAESRTVT